MRPEASIESSDGSRTWNVGVGDVTFPKASRLCAVTRKVSTFGSRRPVGGLMAIALTAPGVPLAWNLIWVVTPLTVAVTSF
jgi:hypothetical protein